MGVGSERDGEILEPQKPSKHEGPRMPADAVARRRLRAWFDAHTEKRLRFIAASPGMGKTIALGELLRSAHAENRPFTYIRLRPKKTAQALRSRIIDALGLPET